jgi:anti-sigma factor RsiW
MSDLHLNFSALPHERPDDDEAREARHQVLATLLGAYADGELPLETVSQIDAHLLGCARCRREVELHTVVRARLAREPVPVASDAFRARIATQIAAAQATVPATAPSRAWWQASRARTLIAVSLVATVLGAGAVIARAAADRDATPPLTRVDAVGIPLMTAVLTDYRRVTAGDLPGRARDLDAVRAAVPFPVEPLRDASMRLLAVWSTDLNGEPAAVLAYRWHDQLVLEYVVAEPAFFRYPGMRAPVASGAAVTAVSGSQHIAAWPAVASGILLVGEVDADALAALRGRGTRR